MNFCHVFQHKQQQNKEAAGIVYIVYIYIVYQQLDIADLRPQIPVPMFSHINLCSVMLSRVKK